MFSKSIMRKAVTKKKLESPLSNFDLLKVISKEMKERGNIFDMSNINGVSDIEQIFKNRGHAILFEPDPNGDIGHWTALVRSPKNCIYFDSYGSKISNERLLNILKKRYPLIQFNPKQFQGYGKSAVCGRYALACVALNKIIPNMTVKHIIKVLEDKPKNMTYDEYIVSLTPEI